MPQILLVRTLKTSSNCTLPDLKIFEWQQVPSISESGMAVWTECQATSQIHIMYYVTAFHILFSLFGHSYSMKQVRRSGRSKVIGFLLCCLLTGECGLCASCFEVPLYWPSYAVMYVYVCVFTLVVCVWIQSYRT